MILKYFLELIIFLAGSFFTLLSSTFPDIDVFNELSTILTTLLGISTQTANFLYFIFGDFLYVGTGIISVILPLKFIGVPVLSFIRKVFVWRWLILFKHYVVA